MPIIDHIGITIGLGLFNIMPEHTGNYNGHEIDAAVSYEIA